MRQPVIVGLFRSDGGVPKLAVSIAEVTAEGMVGDRQRDRRHHGGPDRALCLYSHDRLAALQREGHPIQPGMLGENVLVEGVDWDLVQPGIRLALGGVEIEITDYTYPCSNVSPAFADGRIARISQKVHPGWSRVYARVHRGGEVHVGDPVTVDARHSAEPNL